MRIVNPTPELFIPGHWKKKSDKGAAVNISEKHFQAPLDMSAPSCSIRDHEYEHLVLSEPRDKFRGKYLTEKEQNDSILEHCISALEDLKVNHLGTTRLGFDLGPCGDVDLDENMDRLGGKSFKDKVKESSPLFSGLMYVCSKHYNDTYHYKELFREKLKEANVLDKVEEVMDAITNFTYFNSADKYLIEDGSRNVVKQARILKEIFKKSSTDFLSQKTLKGKDKADDKARCDNNYDNGTSSAAEGLLNPDGYFSSGGATEAEYSLTSLVRRAQTANTKQTIDIWGEMKIVKYPMKSASRLAKVRMKPTKKANQFGATFRYVHRLIQDKAVFSTPKRSALGTILCDWSGSMSIDMDDVAKVLKFASHANIAAYCGKRVDGALQILAQNGRVVVKLPSPYGGNNIVDKPALEWLIKQPGPLFWICDGYVTGINNASSERVSEAVRKLVLKGRVIQYQTLRDFVIALETGKIKFARHRPAKLGIF